MVQNQKGDFDIEGNEYVDILYKVYVGVKSFDLVVVVYGDMFCRVVIVVCLQ